MLVYATTMGEKMNDFSEKNDQDQFANGLSSRDLRVQAAELDNLSEPEGPRGRASRMSRCRTSPAAYTGPDAIHQSYGLLSSLMTQQATMLAAMDCFHLLGLVVMLGLPLALLIRSFQIGSVAGSAH